MLIRRPLATVEKGILVASGQVGGAAQGDPSRVRHKQATRKQRWPFSNECRTLGGKVSSASAFPGKKQRVPASFVGSVLN